MLGPDARLMAGFLDRTRRRLSACRAGEGVGAPGAEVGIRDMGPGFLTWRVVDDGSSTPTASSDRVFWIAPDRAVSGADLDEAIGYYRSLRRARAFFVLGPEAWSEELGAEMARRGMRPWTQVRYPALARETVERAGEEWGSTTLEPRIVTGDDPSALDRVLESIGPWYGREWLGLVRRVVVEAGAELHLAWDAALNRPVAIGGVVVEGDWSYVCFGATEESHRRRGGQTLLFRTRLVSASGRGARWCVGETNSMAEQSLRNFLRCGFAEAFEMRVWGWEEARPQGVGPVVETLSV